MGVTGLLPLLKPICSKGHIKFFAGKRVGIDAYSWLHKGAHGCAMDLCTNKPTRRYVDYFKHRLKMLLHYNVIPVVIFDGDRLPMKALEESDRKRRRAENLEKGKDALRRNSHSEAESCFQRAVDVTPHMAYNIVTLCKRLNVEYLVAPYEADAQLAYMFINGLISAVISEDSDMFVYGVTQLFLKLDKFGEGELLDATKLATMTEPDFAYFTREMVVYMCVLAGCDFFRGVKGIGVRTAHTVVRRYKSFDRLVQLFRYTTKYKDVPTDFEEQFRRACLVFSHQRVFDPVKRELVHLRELEAEFKCILEKEEDLLFLGPPLEAHIAQAIAEGRVDPITKTDFPNQCSVSKGLSDAEDGMRYSRKRLSQPCGLDRGKLGKKEKNAAFSIDKFLTKGSRHGTVKLMNAPFRPPRKLSETTNVTKGDEQKKASGKVTSFFSRVPAGRPESKAVDTFSQIATEEKVVSMEKLTPSDSQAGCEFKSSLIANSAQKRLSLIASSAQKNLSLMPPDQDSKNVFGIMDSFRSTREKVLSDEVPPERTNALEVPETPPRKRPRAVESEMDERSPTLHAIAIEDSLDSVGDDDRDF